jgi:transcriptional regulator with XRE-family HTH domain
MPLLQPLLTTIGDRIRLEREKAGLTKDALAQAIGKHPSMMTYYEQGRYNIPLVTLYQIADQLQVPITALLPPQITPDQLYRTEDQHFSPLTRIEQSIGRLLDRHADKVQREQLERDIAVVKAQKAH